MKLYYCNNDKILYTLTHPQKRIWYIERIYPNTSLYNIGGPIRIKGVINFGILEESINILTPGFVESGHVRVLSLEISLSMMS